MPWLDIILHLDQHLVQWTQWLGPWMYVILFAIIFAETGLVVTPFLPGDSLLFAVGALCSLPGGLNIFLTLLLLTLAGIIGDSVNYHAGRYFGIKAFDRYPHFFKPQYLQQTHQFYAKWGAFTIVAARFAPIVRTFAPFVAGVGHMNYRRFVTYNIIGAVAWVFCFVLAGYFFGNLPFVKKHFHLVIFSVIGISLIPILAPWISSLLQKRKVG